MTMTKTVRSSYATLRLLSTVAFVNVLIVGGSIAIGSKAMAKRETVKEETANTLTPQEKEAGWELLFDGQQIEHWRNFGKSEVSSGWQVDGGTLSRVSKKAGDIVTKKQYAAFELVLDYKIAEGGNSGLMYHVTEADTTPWRSGPEVQIQDNGKGHDAQKSGWLYQLYSSKKDTTRPAGEWNTLRILITPKKCVHWMNGKKYCKYVKGSEDWDAKVAASKFSKFPGFGKATTGHICLQDHGNLVSFRNLKIRKISD